MLQSQLTRMPVECFGSFDILQQHFRYLEYSTWLTRLRWAAVGLFPQFSRAAGLAQVCGPVTMLVGLGAFGQITSELL